VRPEPETASVIEDTLKGLGYNVSRVQDPRDGIALFSDTEFAAVITETRSAKMNGIEVLELLKSDAETKEIPVIMLTNLS